MRSTELKTPLLSTDPRFSEKHAEAINKIKQYKENKTVINMGNGWVWREHKPKGQGQPSAQLRISIYPDKENALKAYDVLLNAYEQDPVSLKMFLPPPINSLTSWDEALCTLPDDEKAEVKFDNPMINYLFLKQNGVSDRHQRGKEVCIYFYPKTDSAIDWKDFLLRGWSALKNAGIKIGYSHPFSDYPIQAEEGITVPFSYAPEYDWKKRHGVLFSREVLNPNNPLKDIFISWQDLEKRKITSTDVQNIHIARYDFYVREKLPALKEGLKQIKDVIQHHINNTDNELASHIKHIHEIGKMLLDPVSSKEQLPTVEEVNNLRNVLFNLYPRKADYDHETDRSGELLFVLNELFSHLSDMLNTLNNEKSLTEKQQDKIKNYLEFLDNHLKEEVAATTRDFLNEELIKEWLEKENLLNDIQTKVQRKPYLMQCIFRKLVHCLRENQYAEYLEKKELLEKIIENNPHAAIANPLKSLLGEVEEARTKTQDTKTALNILGQTHALVTKPNQQNKTRYLNLANRVSGKPSWQKAAWTMLAIGVAAIAVATAIFTGGISIAAAFGTYAAIGSGVSFGISGGLFFAGRRKGLSKTLKTLADTAPVCSL